MSVTESSVCVYDIAIVTSLLCPPEQTNQHGTPKAVCYPLNDDGTPVKRPASILDGGGVEALSALSLAGSQWSGTYDCQGQQWFRMHVHKQWLWDPSTVATQYRHAAVCEKFDTFRIRPVVGSLVSKEYWDVARYVHICTHSLPTPE